MIQFFRSDPKRHIGGPDVVSIRQGYNMEVQKFYIQMLDRKSKDIIRIWLDKDQYEGFLLNGKITLGQHKEESR